MINSSQNVVSQSWRIRKLLEKPWKKKQTNVVKKNQVPDRMVTSPRIWLKLFCLHYSYSTLFNNRAFEYLLPAKSINLFDFFSIKKNLLFFHTFRLRKFSFPFFPITFNSPWKPPTARERPEEYSKKKTPSFFQTIPPIGSSEAWGG